MLVGRVCRADVTVFLWHLSNLFFEGSERSVRETFLGALFWLGWTLI